MDSKKLAVLCRKHGENKKAELPVVLDVRKLSSVTDFFVILSATSEPHMRAITDEIVDKLKAESGIRPHTVDGGMRASWMVIDYVDVIVHVMRAEARSHYDLEGLWGDAPRVKTRSPRAPKATVPKPR
jgi:ribosome-associated protein